MCECVFTIVYKSINNWNQENEQLRKLFTKDLKITSLCNITIFIESELEILTHSNNCWLFWVSKSSFFVISMWYCLENQIKQMITDYISRLRLVWFNMEFVFKHLFMDNLFLWVFLPKLYRSIIEYLFLSRVFQFQKVRWKQTMKWEN